MGVNRRAGGSGGRRGDGEGRVRGPSGAVEGARPEVDGAVVTPVNAKTWQIVLDSGITLADWVMLADDRLDRGEYVAVLAEADAHRRAHGSFPEVEEVLQVAILGDVRQLEGMAKARRAVTYRDRFGDFPELAGELGAAVKSILSDLRISSGRSAQAALQTLASLETIVGESSTLVALQARAHHVLEDYDAAEQAYKSWLLIALPDDPQRKQMALGLFKAQKHEPTGPSVGEVFKDCDACPEMVVVPAGSFMMGSPSGEKDRGNDEGPQHRVTIPASFAVGRFEITFTEWDACVAGGGCGGYRPKDRGWGRSDHPVINGSWKDARSDVAWRSRKARRA